MSLFDNALCRPNWPDRAQFHRIITGRCESRPSVGPLGRTSLLALAGSPVPGPQTRHMATRPVRTFTVLPRLPERLLPLHQLAYNLWWCWHADAVALFRRIDPDRFEQLDHSPIRLLTSTTQKRFEELASDDGFLAHLDRVWEAFQTYMAAPTWFADNHSHESDLRIAYFSAEFGIHESVPVYSGGLGVLAGDHLKS